MISVNLHRRHMNLSQAAMAAARVANMKRQDNLKQFTERSEYRSGTVAVTCVSAAAIFNVSAALVIRAKAVLLDGTAGSSHRPGRNQARATRFLTAVAVQSHPHAVRMPRSVRPRAIWRRLVRP